ncbi:MAG: HEAT repeat domain-containing protein [Rhodopirellula bahusiensis]|uniref:HEAT repeat domain-containing protein n=2 Tax=Rhodopirellula bahusiensis TaxID=2014065 RepID=UPI003263F9D2
MDQITPLILQLISTSVNDRLTAARALVAHGPNASPAIPHLIAALSEPNGPVTDSIMWTLGAIGENAIEPLAKAARSGDSQLHRRMACYALGRYAPHATAKMTTLSSLLNDSDREIRRAAAGSLISLGQHLGRDHEYRDSPLSDDEAAAANQLHPLISTFVGDETLDSEFAEQALMWLTPLR